jgi:coatomer subunit delta
MVVISASICNKNGKILMARQFIPITRMKLEEYVANFPKLIESGMNFTITTINRKAMHSY